MRRAVDAAIADWQFEVADACARSDRRRTRLATLRSLVALARVLVVANARPATRLAGVALAATILLTIAVWTLPLFAALTGAYAMVLTASNLALLLAYLTPTALAVTIPVGVSIGVLALCRGRDDVRRLRVPAAALGIVATAMAAILFVWVAPIASSAFRGLAQPTGGELRVNPPGSIGDSLARQDGVATLAATAVLCAFALRSASAARRWTWVRLAAAVASIVYPFLYVACGALALERALPVSIAAWMPNTLFAAAAVVLARMHRDTA